MSSRKRNDPRLEPSGIPDVAIKLLYRLNNALFNLFKSIND